MIIGFVRGTGGVYKTGKAKGLEHIEIWIDKEHADTLPVIEDDASPILLMLGNRKYIAKLRHTSRNRYLWISPDLVDDETQDKTKLALALKNRGYQKNQAISLSIRGSVMTVTSAYRPIC